MDDPGTGELSEAGTGEVNDTPPPTVMSARVAIEQLDPVLELRVHGVSGTPPEELLDRPLVTRIAGDAIAGFYAPRLPDERSDAGPGPFAPPRTTAPQLAGYSWGGLTSGSPARALWLVLLPLTLVNLAPRSRPEGPSPDSFTVRAIWYLCRVLALSLTCLYVMTGIGVGEDLIGWQCGGGTSCAGASPGWLFHGLSYAHRPSAEHLLLIGALVPVLQLALLWLASSRTADRYERTVADLRDYRVAPDPQTDRASNDVEPTLSSPLMWRNAEPVRRSRALHLQVGFALVLWSLLGPTEEPRAHWYTLSGHWLELAPVAVLGYALVALAMPSFSGRGRSRRWRGASVVVWLLLSAAGLLEVVGLLADDRWVSASFLRGIGGDTPAHRVPAGGLPYYAGSVLAVCGVAVTVLAALIVLVALARGRTPDNAAGDHARLPAALFGMSTAAFAATAVFLAAAFSAGVYTYAATWLSTGSLKPSFAQVSRADGHFVVPGAVDTASIAYAVAVALLIVAVLVLAAVAAVCYVRARDRRGQVARDYPADPAAAPDGDDAARARQIRRAMFLGRVVDQAQWLLGTVVVGGLAVVVWFSIGIVRHRGAAPRHVLGSITHGPLSASALAGDGAYLAVLSVLGLVSLGALAFRVRATRRSVGILWDVASFWPRACHPLAAPCYAERTVPDLVTFITAHQVAHPDSVLVLAAHSQGTVISAATIYQLHTFDTATAVRGPRVDVLPRVGLLTFGCVLRRLYGRFFPVYFGPRELHALEVVLTDPGESTPRWRNLWRYTDYLGGQVTAGPPQVVPAVDAVPPDPAVPPAAPAVRGPVSWEWHSPDPPSFARPAGDTTYPEAHRHSDFWQDESGYFQLAVAELAGRTRSSAGRAGPAATSRARPRPGS